MQKVFHCSMILRVVIKVELGGYSFTIPAQKCLKQTVVKENRVNG